MSEYLEVVDRLAPEGGEKFKRVISKVPPPNDGRRKADSRRQSQDAGTQPLSGG